MSDKLSLSNSDYPYVTVITAVYNAEKYLNECILSVLGQSYKNFEYIIVDGGSTDNTLNIIKQYEDHLSGWISEPDKGIYDAWNKGLAIAKGDWIAFVGADDQLYPNALQTYIKHISEHPKRDQLEFVSSRIELVSEGLLPINTVGDSWTWERFQKEMITWHVGCFHAKHLFLKYGSFDSNYKISGDYELLLRPKDRLVTSFVNETTVKMRLGGISNKSLYKAIDETYRAKIKNGIISSSEGRLLRLIDKLRLLVKQLIGWKDTPR